jgi:hypothetical protein
MLIFGSILLKNKVLTLRLALLVLSYFTIDNEEIKFRLGDFFKEVTGKEDLYFIYLGSITTPPCDDYVYNIIFSKPIKIPTCQLLLFRESSLMTEGKKLSHARMIQNDNTNRKIRRKKKVSDRHATYHTFTKFDNDPNIDTFLPIDHPIQSNEKHLLEREDKEAQFAKSF